MQIPEHSRKPQFYVAVSETEALSAWDYATEAYEELDRLKRSQPEDYVRVIGVIRVSGRSRVTLRKTGPERPS